MSVSAGIDAVLREPRSETARLRFAEQCGDAERAALIRLQLADGQRQRGLLRTRLEDCAEEVQTAHYQEQRLAQRLLSEHAARWTAHLPPGAEYHFGRGFVECVTAAASWWLEHGEQVAAVEPILGVTLSGITPQLLTALLRRPETARLVALSLSPTPDPSASCDALIPSLLAALPGDLRWLELRRLPLRLPHYEALARALTPPRLRWVGLPALADFPVAGEHAPACDEPIVEEDWNHTGRLIDWYTSPLVTHLDRLGGVAAWRHFRPADWRRLLPPPMTLFAQDDD